MRALLSQRVLFLCNPKCATTSIRQVLDPFADLAGSRKESIGNHGDMKMVERFLAEKGHDASLFDVFVTIRSPWARVVSLYHFGLTNAKSVWHAPVLSAGSFKRFCFSDDLRNAYTPTPGGSRSLDIISFGSDAAGVFRPTVFKVEEMDGLEAWLRARGVNVTVPHINRTEHADYRTYYDDDSRKVIADVFKVDITYAGYEF